MFSDVLCHFLPPNLQDLQENTNFVAEIVHFFHVLLTVHLSIILVTDQLNAQILFL